MRDGNKTGVLSGGVASEFQERVISERLKRERRNIEQLEQCDKVSSSSPRQDDTETKDDDDDMETEETKEEAAERELKEKEEEIRKLEEKRKLLENYYKKKLKEKVDSSQEDSPKKNQKKLESKLKSTESRKSGEKHKRKIEDSDSDESDPEDSSQSISSSSDSEKHRHKSKRKRRSKSKSKRSKLRKSRDCSRHESKKNKRKSRRRSSSSTSEDNSSNARSRSTSEKSETIKKMSDKNMSDNLLSTKEPKKENKLNVNLFKSTENDLKMLLKASESASPSYTVPSQLKVKSISQLVDEKEMIDEVFSDTEQTDGKPFLESVDKFASKSSKQSSSPKKSGSSHHKDKTSSSDRRSKSSSHKSSSSRHKSRHKSSSSSNRHKSKHKSSSTRRESSKEKRRRKSESESKTVVEEREVDDAKSPLPDFSEELALLPDFSVEDTGDDYNNVSDGLEEMFAGVEDEDELQRIFQQYEPELTDADGASLRKQKQLDEKEKSQTLSSSESLIGKKRVAHGGSESSDKRPLHLKKPAIRTPAQALHDRYKKLQQMREQRLIEKKLTELTEEDPGEGTSSSLSRKPRVAHSGAGQTPVVMNKAQQQLMAREKAKTAAPLTPAVTKAKGGERVAHTPSCHTVSRPLVTPDRSGKVPTTVRQKYLNSIIEECLKISGGDELEAYTRAEREEKECCRKATSRMFYLNLIVNCVKKLRTEAAAVAARPKQSRPLSESLTEKRPLLTTHLQVLAGKKGTIGTWSNERSASLTVSDVDEKLLFAVMQKYVLTEQQLVDNGYPRTDPTDPGRVTMKKEERRKVDPEKARLVALDDEKRLCERCGDIYLVREDGTQVSTEPCVHHWGRLFRRKGNRGETHPQPGHTELCIYPRNNQNGHFFFGISDFLSFQV